MVTLQTTMLLIKETLKSSLMLFPKLIIFFIKFFKILKKKKKKKRKCNVELKSYLKSITKSGPKMYPCVYKSRD